MLPSLVDQSEFNRCCAALEVPSDGTTAALERACLKKNLTVIRCGTPQERDHLRATYEALLAHLAAQPQVRPDPATLAPIDALAKPSGIANGLRPVD